MTLSDEDSFAGLEDSGSGSSPEYIPPTGRVEDVSRFRLLSELISTPDGYATGAAEFSALEKLIRQDFLLLSADIGFPGESSRYAQLLTMLDDLHDVVEFPYLANKNIVAVGGEFSAGKSRFLNAVFGIQELLPTGVNPTTSIPTYLSYAAEDSILALNTFNRSQKLSREELKAISHAFSEGDDGVGGKVSFYHILKLLQVRSPAMRWKNIAFLDTPGYSRTHADGADDLQGTAAGNTDENKAREHLSNADHLVWVVSAKDGTFRQQGISFLQEKVKWSKDLYLVVNRIDQIPESERKSVFDEICGRARAAGFRLGGVSAYSAVDGVAHLGDDPSSWFDAIDRKRKYTQWRGRFKSVLDDVIRFNAQVERRCGEFELLIKGLLAKDVDLTEESLSRARELHAALVGERAKHKASMAPFAAFCDKVERLLSKTLDAIGVTDETAADVGLTATALLVPGSRTFVQGERLVGTVSRLSKFLGCVIELQDARGEAVIRYRDVVSSYAHPEESFGAGKVVRLAVYEINHHDGKVVFTVETKN